MSDRHGEYLQFGGLAVPEGIMMRSPNYWSVACKAPNGQTVIKTEPLAKSWIGKQNWLKKPFVRGSAAMLDTMVIGMRAMSFASEVQLDEKYAEEVDPDDPTKKKQKTYTKTQTGLAIAFAIVSALAIGFLIFNAVPQAIAQFVGYQAGDRGGMLTNYIAEVVKIIFFIGYLMLIRQWGPIMDVFRYHGAEHKAINCVEAGEELTVENCTAQTRLHPRCGTNFAIIVLVVSFLLFPLIPRYWLFSPDSNQVLIVLSRLVVELLVLPLVAGISYEVIRLAGKAKNSTWVRILLAPGLATQYITTAEPREEHIKVGIQALEAVMRAQEHEELTNAAFDADEPVAVT